MYKKDLVLNNLQWLIWHKTQPTKWGYLFWNNSSDLTHSLGNNGVRIFCKGNNLKVYVME